MKQLTIIFIAFLSIILSSCQDNAYFTSDNNSDNGNNLSLTSASIDRNKIISFIDSTYMSMNTNIYISRTIIPAQTILSSIGEVIISPDYNSHLIFVDLDPLANWGHKCLYIFVNTITRDTVKKEYMFPPSMDNMEVFKQYEVTEVGELFDFSKITSKMGDRNTRGGKWAVIISGGGNIYSNYERYWNDCSAIYSALRNCYNYPKSNIFLLISDGTSPVNDRCKINGTYDSSPTDLDGDGVADTQYSATVSNINTVFNFLSNNVSSGDDVFIYVIDHGSYNGGSSANITLWNNTEISDYNFALQVDKIMTDANIHIVLGQCYSGGFIDDLAGNSRTISTACKHNESSYARADLLYDEFVYHWTSAVVGEYPNGSSANADINNDGCISLSEAFNYANNHDVQNESPQYSSTPTVFGQERYLSGRTPKIIGPDNIYSSSNSVYSISDLPSNASVQWTCHSSLTIVSSTSSTLTVTKNNSANFTFDAWVKATITFSGDVGILQKNGLTVWKSGTFFSDDLITGSLSSDGGSLSLVRNLDGVSFFQWETDISEDYWSIDPQGYFFTHCTNTSNYVFNNTCVSVSFTNPIGQYTKISKIFYF